MVDTLRTTGRIQEICGQEVQSALSIVESVDQHLSKKGDLLNLFHLGLGYAPSV